MERSAGSAPSQQGPRNVCERQRGPICAAVLTRAHRPQSARNRYSMFAKRSAISSALVKTGPVSGTGPLVYNTPRQVRSIVSYPGWIRVRSKPETGERALDAHATLVPSMTTEPERHRRNREGHPTAVSPLGEKAQSSAARTLSISRPYATSHSAVGRVSHSASARSNRSR